MIMSSSFCPDVRFWIFLMARIEAIEGGNNIRVSNGYKPSIEETKSKIRESIVLRRQGSMDLPV